MMWVFGCVRPPPPPPPAPSGSFRFVVVGDRTDEPDDEAWRRTFDQIALLRPDLVVTVGDLADDALDPTDWDRALAGTSAYAGPIAYTPGNHDILDAATAAVFEQRTGQSPHRSFDAGGVHFVIVDNSIAESWDQLPEAQRTWLEADLAAHAAEPVAVFMHKPFWALGAAAGKPDPMHDLFVRTRVDQVYTGHWHIHAHQIVDGVEYTIAGSAGGATGGVRDDRLGNTHQFLWVTVEDGRFDASRVTAGGVFPDAAPSLADTQRARALRLGGVSATIDGDTLTVRVDNVTDQPLDSVVTVDPGDWTARIPPTPISVAPGASFTGSYPVRPGGYPLPRITLSYPLPDAGVVPFTVVADHHRRLEVSRGSAPVLDGALGEWGAPSITTFTTALGAPAATDPTEVWVRYDDTALYLAARCSDAVPAEIQHHHGGRDGQVVYDDRIGFLLAPDPDQVYWFYVNPNGAVWDVHLDRAARVTDRAWDGVEAAAVIDGSGWTAEVRVPFAAMGLTEVPATWGFDVRRRQERLQTEAVFTPAFGSAAARRIGVIALR